MISDNNALKTAIYDLNTKTSSPLSVAFTPEFYLPDTDRVAGFNNSGIYFYAISEDSYETRALSWSPYEANDFTGKHLRGDGGKLVMGAGGLVSEGAGIHILDVANGGGWTRLR